MFPPRKIERRLRDAALLNEMRVHGPFMDLSEFRGCVLAVAARRFERARCTPKPVGEGTAGLQEFVPKYLADLHLAQACARHPRIDEAWRRMLELHYDRLLGRASSFAAGTPEVEVNEFLADLWFVREGGSNLLATYAGLAPLGAWLQLVLRRRLARRRQRAVVWSSLCTDQESRTAEPAEFVVRKEFLSELSGSLHQSLDALSLRDRDFVESRILRREEGTAIARRHGVSPSFVSRRSREVLGLLRERLAAVLDRFGVDLEGLG